MVSRTYDKNTPDDCGESVFGGCRGGNSGCQNPQQQPESGNAAFGEGKTSHAAPEQGRYGRPECHSPLGAVLSEAKSACPANQLLKPLMEKRAKAGIVGAPIRLMIVGIPNVGKSSFINRMAQSKKAKVEDRPGVTRTKQWVKIGDQMELLDMPGVLWPKFDDQEVAKRLAFTGAIKDDIMDLESLAMLLLEFLAERYPKALEARYKMQVSDADSGLQLLEQLGRKRGMLISGGEVNYERAAITVLDEFRSGTLGRLTLELPEA